MVMSTLSSPTNMTLHLPKESGKDSVDHYSHVKTKLTLILLKDEKVFGYYGDFINGGRPVSLDETSELIADGWKMYSRDSLVVVIKPTKDASYKSMIDINNKEKEFLKIAE